MRKPKKLSTSKAAPLAPPAAAKTSDLPRLSQEEAQKAWNKARIARNIHGPENLRTVWAKKMEMVGAAGVQALLSIIRAGVNSPEMDKTEQTAAYLARLLEGAVARFENLVQTGAMDEVLPRMAALPVLYSLYAGKGSPEWKWARELFEAKKVGTEAVSAHRGSNYAATRNSSWKMLAVEAVKVARMAAIKLPIFDAYREEAIAVGDVEFKRPGGRYIWRASVYLLSDKGVLIWPDWLSACRGLPQSVKDNIEGYQEACRLMLKGFFGDPENKWGDDLLKTRTKLEITSVDGRNVKYFSMTSGRARLESVESVVDAIATLGV